MLNQNGRIRLCAIMLVVAALLLCGCSGNNPVTINRAATTVIDSTPVTPPALTPAQTQAPTAAALSPTANRTVPPSPTPTQPTRTATTGVPSIAITSAAVATPKPTETPAAADEQADDAAIILVWKAATGSKYHSKNNCGNMNPDKAVQITLDYAKSIGLEPCKNCNPPR